MDRAPRLISLSHGAVTVVDDSDYERLSGLAWVLFRSRKKFYAVHSSNVGGHHFMHRLLLDAPEGVEVDHADGDGLNNRRDNIRLASRTENTRNAAKRVETSRVLSSQYKGVKYVAADDGWQARIGVSYSTVHLGVFNTELEAAVAYDAAAKHYFGAFARLNFPASSTPSLEAATAGRRRRLGHWRGGYHGVTLYRDGVRWMAAAYAGRKRFHLGLFATAEDAARAYDGVARSLRPDAPLNFSQS